MEDVELVVKIPNGAYNLLKTNGVDWLGAEHILNAVANGIPLPKGHGPLIDAYELYPTCRYYKDCDHEVRCDRCKFEGDYVVSEKDLAAVSIIIEADKDQMELSVEESIKQRIARDVEQGVKAHTASGFIQGIRSPFE